MTTTINKHETTIHIAIDAVREMGQTPNLAIISALSLPVVGGVEPEEGITTILPDLAPPSVLDVLPDIDDGLTLASLGVVSWQEAHRDDVARLGLQEIPSAIDFVRAAMAAEGRSPDDLVDQVPVMRQLREQHDQANQEDLKRFAEHLTMNQPRYCPHCGVKLR